jgi:hypothetical protein
MNDFSVSVCTKWLTLTADHLNQICSEPGANYRQGIPPRSFRQFSEGLFWFRGGLRLARTRRRDAFRGLWKDWQFHPYICFQVMVMVNFAHGSLFFGRQSVSDRLSAFEECSSALADCSCADA